MSDIPLKSRPQTLRVATIAGAVGLSLAMIAGTRPEPAVPVSASRIPTRTQGRKPVIPAIAVQAPEPQAISYVMPAIKTDEAWRELLRPTKPSDDVTAAPLEAAVTPVITPRRIKMLRMQVTAYCACIKCCGPNAHGVTASGVPVSYNGGVFVAADTSVLPFGTKIQVPGYHSGEPVEIVDRGGAIKGKHIDLYFRTHQQALEWGRQWLDVKVVE